MLCLICHKNTTMHLKKEQIFTMSKTCVSSSLKPRYTDRFIVLVFVFVQFTPGITKL